MTDRLTTEEIQDLRAKSAAATKGPWRIDDNYDLWPEVRAEDSSLAAECLSWDNGKLIATMRNTLDRLLDELMEHRERENPTPIYASPEVTAQLNTWWGLPAGTKWRSVGPADSYSPEPIPEFKPKETDR